MASYSLKVVTPERTVYEGPVTFLIARSSEGEIGILAHHVNMVTPLVPHLLAVTLENGQVEHMHVGGGFLEIGPEHVIILADAAELPDEVDVARAENARERARTRIDQGGSDLDLRRAKMALERAEARLRLASMRQPAR